MSAPSSDPAVARPLRDADITLRPICAEDEAFLLDLYASTREDELRAVPWSDEQKQAFLAMQFAAQSLHYASYPNPNFSAVLAGPELAGRLYVSRTANDIRVVDIIVAPPFQSRGLGTLLLSRLMDESDASGVPLTIHVERENRAISWYERLGFEPVDDIGTHYFMRRRPRASAT